jgi:hypothetical protein
LNLYDYLASCSIDNPLVKTFGADLFIYPPLIYLLHGVFNFLFSMLFGNEVMNGFVIEQNSFFGNHWFNFHLLLIKIPYLLFDLPAVYALINLFENKRDKLFAALLWLFNPIILYSAYMMGQFDIIDKYYEHENAILRKIHRITAKQIEVKNNNGIEPITSGNYGRIIGGDNSINIGGDNCSNIGGMFSTNIGGDFSYNTGGSFSKNTGRIRSKNTGLDYSTNIGGIESFNRGGRGSFNRGEANSKNIGGEQSTNIGGFNSINAGGLLSSLSFMYFQGNRRKIYTITVGENGVLPNVCYKFNETKLIHYEYDDAI